MLNVNEIREIIKLIDESSINEFSYESNGSTIHLKKFTQGVETSHTQQIVQPDKKQPLEVTEKNPSISTTKENEQVAKSNVNDEKINNKVDYDVEIVSPMVGTFYRKPSPDSEPYVTLNSKVEENTIVCIVEAMKLFNEIEAETSGEIVEILVEDGELVEYGQPLFRVKKN